MTDQQLKFVLSADARQMEQAFGRAKSAANSLASDGLRQAAEQTQELGRQSGLAGAAMGVLRTGLATLGPVIAGAFSVHSLVSFVEKTTEAAEKIQRLSELAGSNTTEFQRYAAGAKSAGVDMEKFSDIMKDTQDKLGDFFVGGGGELKDFFEKIAPKVKVTADEFRSLSGPEALQLFYTSLEKANVGQKVLVNQMEAIADDAALLIPLLRNNGAGFAEMAAQAEKAGTIMSEKAVKEAVELGKQLKELKAHAEGAANSISSSLIPVLNNLAREFKAGKEAFGGIGSALFNLGTAKPFDNAVTGLQHYQGELRKVQGTLDKIASGEEKSTGLYGTDRVESLKAQAQELQKFVTYYQKVLGLNSQAGAGRGVANPAAKAVEPWKIPQEEKKKGGSEKSEYDRYIEQLNSAMARTLDLSAAEQARYDIANGKLGKLTKAQEQYLVGLAEVVDVMKRPAPLVGPEIDPQLLKERAEDQRRLNEMIAATPTAKLEQTRKAMQQLADEFSAGRLSAEEFAEAAQTRLGTLPDDVKKVGDVFDDLKSSIEGWGRDAAAAMVDFAITGKSSFGDMANSILADMARMATYRLITQPLFNAVGSMLPTMFGSTGSGGEISGPGLKMANGGAWDAGLQKFANGGAFTNSVVDSPTLFKFAKGTGLMGEAGPEAIMPLRRDASGRLGITAAGMGGGPSVNVEIKNYSGAPVTQRSVPDGRGGRRMEVVIGELAAGEMRRPGSSMNTAAREAYGLAPALVGR